MTSIKMTCRIIQQGGWKNRVTFAIRLKAKRVLNERSVTITTLLLNL